MILKLTNASPRLQNNPILINLDHIISIFEDEVEGSTVTILYSKTQETWQVTETINLIYDLIKNTQSNEVV